MVDSDRMPFFIDRRLNVMTKPKVIVIWGCEDILTASIEGLLSTITECHVIRITSKEDLEALLSGEETRRPDIVIINRQFNHRANTLPLHLLQDHPAIKVIAIGLENNLMEIYSKQNILVQQTSDLIGVIQNEP